MIKRPLNAQFKPAVLEDRKITTIREKPWPVGVPIMLYHWEGKAYNSPHVDVAVIEVMETCPIEIDHHADGVMTYAHRIWHPNPLWACEGFKSSEAMDAWFRQVVKPGRSLTRHLMRFRRHPVYLGMPDPLKK